MNATRKVMVLVAATAVIAGAVGIGAGWIIRSPAQIAADQQPPARTMLTAEVVTGVIEQRRVFSGIVEYGDEIAVNLQGDDASPRFFTSDPVAVGEHVVPGAVLAEINDRPLLYLSAPVPMLRDLYPGDSGADVTRLQTALEPYGLEVPDGTFGASTSAALERLYTEAGYIVPLQAEGGAALRSELLLAPGRNGTVIASAGARGGIVEEPLLMLTSVAPVVTASVPSANVDLQIGQTVTVTGAGLEGSQPGHVERIGSPSAESDSGALATPVQIALDVPAPFASVGGTAEVVIVEAESAPSGLIVPVAALHSDASGQTFVSVALDEAAVEQTHVEVLQAGDGRARVRPTSGQLQVGDAVVVGIG